VRESIDAPIASIKNESRRGKSRPRRKHKPRHIPLPDGDELWPRAELATKVIGITERTAFNHKWPVVYISNVAYCPKGKVLALMASRIRHAPEPVQAKRGKRR
jgi:hypothetical protein